MAKFRKKPVVVEAVQFNGSYPLPPGVGCGANPGERPHFFVTTAHGQQATVVAVDWIITEPDGRGHYPCKPDIFEATYERVEG